MKPMMAKTAATATAVPDVSCLDVTRRGLLMA